MLKIGDEVEVFASIEMAYKDGVRKAYRSRHHVKGVICGATRRQLGRYNKAYNGWDDYEPAYLSVTGTVLVYQVKEGLMRRSFDVLPFDLKPLDKETIVVHT